MMNPDKTIHDIETADIGLSTFDLFTSHALPPEDHSVSTRFNQFADVFFWGMTSSRIKVANRTSKEK